MFYRLLGRTTPSGIVCRLTSRPLRNLPSKSHAGRTERRGATLRFAVWQQGGTERRCPRPLDDSHFRGRRESNPRLPFEIGSSRALQRKLQTEELSKGNRRTGTKLPVFRRGGNRTRNLPAQRRTLYPVDVTDPSIASESSICSLRTRRNGDVLALYQLSYSPPHGRQGGTRTRDHPIPYRSNRS